MKKTLLAVLLFACVACAETVVERGFGVQVSADGLTTIPSNSIATPAQVSAASVSAADALDAAETAQAAAAAAAVTAAAARANALALGTNFIVTSTVYVQSIGGVPYDPSNQTIRVESFGVVGTNVVIIGTVKQLPLVAPKLDWRQAIGGGAWSNVAATVVSTNIPAGVTNAVAAYAFTLPRPTLTSAFFRIVDNSSGASGSGLYWLVFGGITVDGHLGRYATLTNVVGSVTNTYLVKGGVIVEPTPL